MYLIKVFYRSRTCSVLGSLCRVYVWPSVSFLLGKGFVDPCVSLYRIPFIIISIHITWTWTTTNCWWSEEFLQRCPQHEYLSWAWGFIIIYCQLIGCFYSKTGKTWDSLFLAIQVPCTICASFNVNIMIMLCGTIFLQSKFACGLTSLVNKNLDKYS